MDRLDSLRDNLYGKPRIQYFVPTVIQFLYMRGRVLSEANAKLFKQSKQYITFLVFHGEVLPPVRPVHPNSCELGIVIRIPDLGDTLPCRAICRIRKRNGNVPSKRSAGPSKGESARLLIFVCIFSYVSSNRPGDGLFAIPKVAGALTIASRSNVVSKDNFITFSTRSQT